ncbi:tyrosine-type recombinase/integrase [Pseudomonas sp. P8_241]|uniref:tyrosine-type recombinase/integrase n=1 Tax=Pseudomonas sp. P8_241 TaxID=3043445 RepID=UPI002A35A146|nr:tyrosine-type recombinase/integrase [Pseudomonas sp. P8_241]WPN49169.1 tyrosine-type recombinase/integrase [Pseudomonas sp. P8_241]
MTRYPKAGKGGEWKVKELQAIPADWKGDTISDGGGLSGEVRVKADGSISIRFKYAFRWHGKVAWHQCGTFPDTGVANIRTERDRARQKVAEGINPSVEKKANRIKEQAANEAVIAEAERKATENLTVADLFDEWLKDGVARQDGNAELRRSFGKNVLPFIGEKALRDLTEKDLLAVLRALRARGLNRGVVILNNDMGQMLRWAEKRKPWRGLMIDGNPAELVEVKKLLDHDYQEQRDRVLCADEIRELRDIFERMERDYAALPAGQKYSGVRPLERKAQLALWICLSTLCRIGELLKGEWQHVDLENGTWLIPAQNTKGQRGKRQDHHVFLSPFALRHFRELHTLTGETSYLFPATNNTDHVDLKSISKRVGDRQEKFKNRSKPLSGRRHDNTLVLNQGTKGEWTPHDLRRTGATMMQELGVTLEIIDRCQNHLLGGSKVRRHYLHHDYASEKRNAWRILGERLEMLANSDAERVCEWEVPDA